MGQESGEGVFAELAVGGSGEHPGVPPHRRAAMANAACGPQQRQNAD